MKITSKSMHFGLLAIIGLLLIALPISAFKIDSLMAARSQVKLKAKSEALDQEQKSFEVARQNIKKYAGLEKISKAIVPQDKNQAEAVREIVNIAASNGVALGSITFPPSTLGGSTPGATGPSSGPTPSATSPPTSANSSQNKLSQLTAVTGIPGVYQLPITITSDSSQPLVYSQLISFLSDLENNRRTAQVESISIDPVGSGNYLSFTITLNEYIKP